MSEFMELDEQYRQIVQDFIHMLVEKRRRPLGDAAARTLREVKTGSQS